MASKIKGLKERFFLWIKENRTLFISIIAVVVILLILFGAKIFLYVNFILGNDIIIKLESSKENIFLEKGQKENITFESSVTTNPFCSALCESKFIEISNGLILSNHNFTLTPANPLVEEFEIQIDKSGRGQKLYLYSIECRSVNTIFCHTDEEGSTSRDVLVTVDYSLSKEEKEIEDYLINNFNSTKIKLEEIISRVEYMENLRDELENRILIENIENITKIKQLILDSESKIINLQNVMNDNNYQISKEEFDEINNNTNLADDESFDIFLYLSDVVLSYNNIIDNLVNLRNSINHYIDLQSLNETQDSDLNYIIHNFNIVSRTINNETSITEINLIVNNLSEESQTIFNRFNKEIENQTNNKFNSSFINVEEFNLNKILLDLSNKTIYAKLEEPLPLCCAYNNCESCCITNECINNEDYYPVVFIHGHAINQDLAADYSLDAFNKIQKRLANDGYINAGSISLYNIDDTKPGVWGLIRAPVSIKASYYLDVFREPENYVVVQVKSENIETYSIRLREIIDNIKIKTGKPKVNIITHSMGGLVVRRYLQLFGSDDVNKLIMIGSPNKGITGDAADYCSLIGGELECRDMNSNSLFINKLNTRKTPEIDTYNIIGTGCLMDGEDGDGVVLSENAELENAKNFFIDGNCQGLETLHVKMLDINRYPKVYDIIKNSLME